MFARPESTIDENYDRHNMGGSALVAIFPAFNSLDINGPISILSNSDFSITIAAKEELTTSQENIIVKRTISFQKAHQTLSEYDILIVPGSRSRNILPYLQPENAQLLDLLDLVAGFAKPEHPPIKERTILSVCIGGYFLGAAGVLDGLTATTHRLATKGLRTACENYARRTPDAKGTKILPENPSVLVPYCDAGVNDFGVRVITTGSVTYGIDATLYYVASRFGNAVAVEIAELIGHNWREVKA
jgi:transcriptional regulator GlxA family with amidase domain